MAALGTRRVVWSDERSGITPALVVPHSHLPRPKRVVTLAGHLEPAPVFLSHPAIWPVDVSAAPARGFSTLSLASREIGCFPTSMLTPNELVPAACHGKVGQIGS